VAPIAPGGKRTGKHGLRAVELVNTPLDQNFRSNPLKILSEMWADVRTRRACRNYWGATHPHRRKRGDWYRRRQGDTVLPPVVAPRRGKDCL
jgi:hypothetical protein